MHDIYVRVILSALLGLIASVIIGYLVIPALRRLKAGQTIRDDGPQSHLAKAGTPTMGGIMIMLAVIITCFAVYTDGWRYTVFAIAGSLAFGLVGFVDDMIIVVKRRSLGLKPWQKIFCQILFSFLIAWFAYNDAEIGSGIIIPIFNQSIDLGILYIPFTMFVIIAMVNSVNLIDGLDGLAASVASVNFITFAIIFLGIASTCAVYAQQMSVFSAAMLGGCLGFLRFNSHPAKVFMGDTGSFFLGGALSMMAIASGLHLILIVIGIMYVLTSLSCIIQVGYYKRTHKRVFKMAPLHHHFELSGIKETKIVSTYTLVTAGMCMIALLMLS